MYMRAELALSASAEWPRPLDFAGQPMRVAFKRTGACDAASRCPTVRRVDGCSLEIDSRGYRDVFDAFLVCLALARISDQ
jgi:D-aminopeptidase